MENLEIQPKEVKARMERGERFLLVDVRQPWEFDLCRIEGAKLVPLDALSSSITEIAAADDVIVYCHHGRRSLDAVVFLRQQGVEGARSLAGGIERWSAEIDPKVPRY
jgi:rhodanese-related sulfurtransferase